MKDLRQCPFCGNEKICLSIEGNAGLLMTAMHCKACGCYGPSKITVRLRRGVKGLVETELDAQKKAEEAWNRRLWRTQNEADGC